MNKYKKINIGLVWFRFLKIVEDIENTLFVFSKFDVIYVNLVFFVF